MAESRLTDDLYWDEVWGSLAFTTTLSPSPWKRFLLEAPVDRQFWRQILPKFVPKPPARALEIGSAPGHALLRWRESFGHDVYGLDISGKGLEYQRRLFAKYGVAEDHSIFGDFLDPKFQDRYEGYFDVVQSAGVIEHFADPDAAVAAHLRVLKPAGTLIVSVPNIVGMYRLLMTKEVVATHNLNTTRMTGFRKLFELSNLQPQFCGYYGQLNLGVAYDTTSLVRRNLTKLQIPFNVLLRVLPLPENRWTSPQLLFIGKKLR